MKKIVNLPKIGERIETASRFIFRCQKLLDVGCGKGDIFYFIRSKVSKIYGIDKSTEDLVQASERGIVTRAVDLDRQNIPYEKDNFDIVTCLDVIEHIKDPIKLIKDIHRVLKNGGRLIVSSPNIRFSSHLNSLVLKGRFPLTSVDKSAYDGGHIHYFTFNDLKQILLNNGFKIEHKEGIINKPKRGIKGRIAKKILGNKFMLEFRSPGILIVAKKI